jgi:hypothetical protein
MVSRTDPSDTLIREIVFSLALDVKATRDAWTLELKRRVMRAAERMRGKFFFMGLPFAAVPRSRSSIMNNHNTYGSLRHGILIENQILLRIVDDRV